MGKCEMDMSDEKVRKEVNSLLNSIKDRVSSLEKNGTQYWVFRMLLSGLIADSDSYGVDSEKLAGTISMGLVLSNISNQEAGKILDLAKSDLLRTEEIGSFISQAVTVLDQEKESET